MEFLNIALTFAMDDLHVLIKKTKELTNARDSGIRGRGGGGILTGLASPR